MTHERERRANRAVVLRCTAASGGYRARDDRRFAEQNLDTHSSIPFGSARVVKPGQSLTVVTYGALVQKSLLAATQFERRNPRVSIEVIDLRSLAPYDWEAICRSVEKTSRVLMAHEDTLSFGYGAEIAARIGDELFGKLDAPVRRVGALDTWVGYHPRLEAAILPQPETLAAEMERLLGY